jgi:hypothetical protein
MGQPDWLLTLEGVFNLQEMLAEDKGASGNQKSLKK